MQLSDPLWLLLFIPLVLLWRRERKWKPQAIRMPQENSAFSGNTWRARARRWLGSLRWIALSLMILALVRPQRKWEEEKVKADALDIMLAMDISPSMLSRDFDPDRLSTAKQVAIDFVEKRPHDRIGLVAFSAEAFTQCPLTTDRKVVQAFIRELAVGRLEDGTAIGMGLATALNRLKESAAKSKIVILLTDGENNAGYISPLQAADLAKALGVKVYCIGIGTEGIVMSPVQRTPDGSYLFAPRETEFNTELLEKIADETGGKFYRAYSGKDLEGIYDQIDRLEKTRIEVTRVQRSTDYFSWFLTAAIGVLLLELFLRWTLLRSATP